MTYDPEDNNNNSGYFVGAIVALVLIAIGYLVFSSF